MKKHWKLQCLICKHSRKIDGLPIVICVGNPKAHKQVFYGSDMFTGFVTCPVFDEMADPFKKEANG